MFKIKTHVSTIVYVFKRQHMISHSDIAKKKKKKHSDIISDVDWLRADSQMIVCLSRAISGGTEHASRGAICAAYDVCK